MSITPPHAGGVRSTVMAALTKVALRPPPFATRATQCTVLPADRLRFASRTSADTGTDANARRSGAVALAASKAAAPAGVARPTCAAETPLSGSEMFRRQ